MSPALLLVAALHAAPQGELLEFTAKWCGPCQQVKPIVERLRREGLPIRPVDVDQHRDLARHYNIDSIPTFVLVVSGQEVWRRKGAQSEATLRQVLAKIPAASAAAEAVPEKKGWFNLPWKKDPPPTESPNFDDGAAADDTIYRGQQPEAQTVPDSAASPSAPPAAGDPIATAVRIRVKDEKGVDFGSGTVIGSKDGAALVLTCWHIFRDFGETADVEVDLFPNGPGGQPETFPGKLIRYDDKADVALVGVRGCGLLPVSPVAATDQFPKEGDHVFSVGCGEGKPPTKEQHAVTRLNPYQGPDTTECTGMPVVGRSGGGLFDVKGRVIGVCFAADREDRRGVYAGPAEIHKLIETSGYAALIPSPGGAVPAGGPAVDIALEDAAQNESTADAPGGNPFDDEALAEVPREVPDDSLSLIRTGGVADSAVAVVDSGVAVEATVILRRLDDPDAPSEVIVINKVSDRFRRYLKGELAPNGGGLDPSRPAGRQVGAGESASQPVETAFRVPGRNLDRSRLVTADFVRRTSPAPFVRGAGPGRSVRSSVALLARVFDNPR